MKTVTNIELKDLINETAGRYPVYVKITNGDNTGSDVDYPDYYRFDYDAPELTQIQGHENEAKGNRPEDMGVNYFVTLVFKSRNIDITKFSCSIGTATNPGKAFLTLPRGMSLNFGVATYDWSIFKLMQMTNTIIRDINCGIQVFGSFGIDLPSNFGKLLPEIIKGNLTFVSNKHSGSVDLDVLKVMGSFFANNLNIVNWKPRHLGKKGGSIILSKCGNLPDLSSCNVDGNLMVYKTTVKIDSLPDEINGNVILCGCNLGKFTSFPNVHGDLTIVGDRTVDFSEVEGKPVIDGNLTVADDMVKSDLVSLKTLEEKFEVKGKILTTDDSKIVSQMENLNGKTYIDFDDNKLSALARAGKEFAEEQFGTLGLLAFKKLYKLKTGKDMPEK